MNQGQNMLIKDPYLNTSTRTDHLQRPQSTSLTYAHSSNPQYSQNNLKAKLLETQNDFKRLTRAYTEQEKMNKKIIDYQAVNGEYHEAMKMKNLQLNSKVQSLTMENKLINQKFEEDYLKSYHDRDMIVRKFQDQSEQILYLKKNMNNLIDCKTKLEDQINRLTFLMEKEADRFSLEMRETVIRMQNMEITLKKVIETKEDEITQLRHRLRVYEDENKRLNEFNRTLQLTSKEQKVIDNLSHIHHPESQTKEMKSVEKENRNLNSHYDPQTLFKELEEQRNVNQQLQRQIKDLKKRKLFNEQEEEKRIRERSRSNPKRQQQLIFDVSKCEGLIASITTLRNGINKQVFDVFFKSVRDGEKHRSNSLVIFIENWKNIQIDRIQPYIISYFQARNNLKEIALDKQIKKGALIKEVQEVLPIHVGAKKGRNEINTWILSTVQFTKNQREVGKKTLNNLLLFLFRLLTIEYRITYPMQGKSYVIDTDVRNELLHEITKAIHYIIEYK